MRVRQISENCIHLPSPGLTSIFNDQDRAKKLTYVCFPDELAIIILATHHK